MALYDRPYALGSVALLLPFFLLIRYRQRKNQLNLPCAGSGWRTPSFLLPIVSLFWARDLIEDVYNKVRLLLSVLVQANVLTSWSTNPRTSLNHTSFLVYWAMR